jgi:cation diffusion facilitator family transporter
MPNVETDSSATAANAAGTAARARGVQRVLLVTLGLNLGAAAVKLLAGLASGSLALAAGGLDSVFDGAANVFGLVAMRAAAQPPDAGHPYGHRKFETLVAAVIAMLLFITCGRLIWSAIEDIGPILAGAAGPTVDLATLLAPALAFGFNTVASRYEARWGRRLGSELLLADASHTRADAVVSLGLIVGLGAIWAGYPLVDPLLALVIAGVIARTGIAIMHATSAVLADAAVLDPAAVAQAAQSVPGVIGTHKVRSRGPADEVSIDLHVQVDPALSIAEAHAIGHAVQARLREHFGGVTEVLVHVEPAARSDGQRADH